ncbi:unnamed protein product [Notodromas monacha]|uniref:Elongation of very long chain fatty acids protein n=1 Tax=Notodromas monacha TaxID=399045 RepID=A0A7R9C0L9_9CRUS|nr:unnamed protein product [Notodromas monacha]CAG0924713.1 unnamed protein product [Notodromas monacha]
MNEQISFIFRFSAFTSYAFCNAVTAVWTWWFAHSKLLELGDTVFIVLRKRHLMFLHWYHHITVLVYTWFSMSNFSSHGRWFVTCNLAIHAVMYSYYAVRALGIRIPRSISMAVTSSQLLQMILGIFISVSAYGFKRRGVPCSATTANLFASSLMYMSYFLLFLKFFFDAYLAKSLARAKKTDGDQLVKAAMTKFVEKETADVAARLRRIRHAATY